jgi:predicted Rossmann-fold nucleotide-binding protein
MWGGSSVGMMKIIADVAKEAHGKLIGDSEETFKQKARKNAVVSQFEI